MSRRRPSLLARLQCLLLGHDVVAVYPIAFCRRCPERWGQKDPHP